VLQLQQQVANLHVEAKFGKAMEEVKEQLAKLQAESKTVAELKHQVAKLQADANPDSIYIKDIYLKV
jgi:hypothetical protein